MGSQMSESATGVVPEPANVDHDDVALAIREVCAQVIMPRFRALGPTDVMEKGPGDLVTVADQLAEKELTSRLLDLEPGSQVVGEESVAAEPTVLERASADGTVWIIDPIDGTGSFARGQSRFAVMVARLVDGQTVSGWIWQPMDDRMFVAHRRGGAFCNGVKLLRRDNPRRPLDEMTGDVRTTFFVDHKRLELMRRFAGRDRVLVDHGGACGYVYPELATGELDFAVFGRQYPWDHAPGALILEEAGGIARDLDGAPYLPTHTTWGLLSVSHHEQWDPVHRELFG